MDRHVLLFLFLFTANFIFIASNKKAKSNSKRKHGKEDVPVRGLISGDTFTPIDLLPVAHELILKMKQPGEGKGIVSSARSAGELADKIFSGFFLTTNRIAVLSDFDIDGLDSLQALALSGLVIKSHSDIEAVREDNIVGLGLGKTAFDDTKPKHSKYKLMVKKLNKNGRKAISKLASRLPKLVRIKVNPKSDSKNDVIKRNKKQSPKKTPMQSTKPFVISARRDDEKKATQSTNSDNNDSTDSTINPGTPIPDKVFITKTPKDVCKWKYHCESKTTGRMCEAIVDCDRNCHPGKKNEFSIYHREDEHEPELKKFRKMIGITLVDEEVEKIIQVRVLTKRPLPQVYDGPLMERVETLGEYFNFIIENKHLGKGGGPATQPGVPRYVDPDDATEDPGIQNESPITTESSSGLPNGSPIIDVSNPANKISVNLVRIPPYKIFES